jgi:hypothetical protein
LPDLKLKLDRLFSDAADCQLIGDLASDPAKRAEYRRRAELFRALAEQVRTQITARPRSDIEFLAQQALRCRRLAATISDDAMQADLMTLAQELENKANQERGAASKPGKN